MLDHDFFKIAGNMISSPMHIAFCVNDHYAEYILVSIKGLLENNSDPLVIHILSDYISDKNTNRLKKLVGLYPNGTEGCYCR